MTITKQVNCSLECTGWTVADQWCVYEHYVPSETPGTPPLLIFIGACKLIDVFNVQHARNNSDWTEIFAHDRPLLITVVETMSTQEEAMNRSIVRVRALPEPPRCNLHGFNLFGQKRRLACSNGQEYATQAHAAKALNISQGAISRHLKGHLSSVKGFTFTYVTKAAR